MMNCVIFAFDTYAKSRGSVIHTYLVPIYYVYIQYEDALDSPLEQCISDSMVRNKDSGIGSIGGNLFSLVPSGVPSYKPSQTIMEEPEPQPISSPDSFSDFFSMLSGMTIGLANQLIQ